MKRRRSEPYVFDERLNAEKIRVEAQLEETISSPQRDMLARKLRQIDTALHINGWISSPGLQPPKLTLG
jgi:phage FluMu protein gp41